MQLTDWQLATTDWQTCILHTKFHHLRSNTFWDMNFCPVAFGPVMGPQTDRKWCIRAHCAEAQVAQKLNKGRSIKFNGYFFLPRGNLRTFCISQPLGNIMCILSRPFDVIFPFNRFFSPPVQVARWALMRRFPSVCDKNSYYIINHSWKGIVGSQMKIGHNVQDVWGNKWKMSFCD